MEHVLVVDRKALEERLPKEEFITEGLEDAFQTEREYRVVRR